jgi:hypothetical protein
MGYLRLALTLLCPAYQFTPFLTLPSVHSFPLASHRKMLSAETKHRLGELLHAVSENERAVETTRQILAETHTFAPMHLFTALDVSGRGISTSDLIRFLTTMRVYCSSNDAYLIVR